ncbi:MAG: Rieske (2Fe-2S) protein [Arachnia sp.]
MTPARRDVLVAGAGIAASLLSACSGNPTPSLSAGTNVTVAKSSVPVGSGVVLASDGVVVTQPAEGSFVAFSSRCTHQDCDVSELRPAGIYCGCHGSVFDIADGRALEGPAEQPLRALSVEASGEDLVVTL